MRTGVERCWKHWVRPRWLSGRRAGFMWVSHNPRSPPMMHGTWNTASWAWSWRTWPASAHVPPIRGSTWLSSDSPAAAVCGPRRLRALRLGDVKIDSDRPHRGVPKHVAKGAGGAMCRSGGTPGRWRTWPPGRPTGGDKGQPTTLSSACSLRERGWSEGNVLHR